MTTSDPSLEFEQWIHPPLRNCWFLTGATCSGKTPLAIAVAERLNAEIVSLDSMAIYRGMNIGTAKPGAEQRARVPHHLIDIIEPTQSFSVSNYAIEAHATARKIWQIGRNVLFCGGTPLYLKGLIRGLFLGPSADWEFRSAVEKDVERYGQDALISRLLQVDPLLAHKLHPRDHRRIIRALEVAKITGRPLSHWQQQFDSPASKEQCPVVVLQIERAWLHEKINQRVDSMIAEGLEQEVTSLIQQHRVLGRTAAQAVGYREMLEHLNGQLSLEKAIEQIKAHTRQFARRQEIWFRGLVELQRVEIDRQKNAEQLCDDICKVFEACPQKDSHASGT